jgi:hypothetical protein
MRRFARLLLVTLFAGTVTVGAAVAVSLAWNDRAEDVCRNEAPQSAGGHSVTWEWSEFAYVCDYRARDEQPRRVGIIDAFHGEGRRRHR